MQHHTITGASLWREVSALSVADATVEYDALRARRESLYATAHGAHDHGSSVLASTARADAATSASAREEHAATELRAHLLSRRAAGLGLHPTGCSLCAGCV